VLKCIALRGSNLRIKNDYEVRETIVACGGTSQNNGARFLMHSVTNLPLDVIP
jgi:hypothetical protein